MAENGFQVCVSKQANTAQSGSNYPHITAHILNKHTPLGNKICTLLELY